MLGLPTLFLAFIVAKALVLPAPLQAPIHGYTIEDMVSTVDVFGNGTLVNITGTIQDVYKQLRNINPSFHRNITTTSTKSKRSATHIDQGNLICGPSLDPNNAWWTPAQKQEAVRDGVLYLHEHPGQPNMGPGPGACWRVSCSECAGIFLCNDNKEPKVIDSWEWVGDCADRIYGGCMGIDVNYGLLGQNFEQGNWNCIVRDDPC
ncbi:hypothetical protein V8F20_007540 [Naviculisporaceae sp. PSN 640]